MGPKVFSDSYLKNNGIDAEEVKNEWGYGSETDIYNGDTITFRDKSGKLEEDTGLTKEEFFDKYQKDGEEYDR